MNIAEVMETAHRRGLFLNIKTHSDNRITLIMRKSQSDQNGIRLEVSGSYELVARVAEVWLTPENKDV